MQNIRTIKLLVVLIVVPLMYLAIVIHEHFSLNSDLEIFFLNVGQGDSTLIKTPDNRWGLIDSGRDSSLLWELAEVLPVSFPGFDFVLATHGDADHIGGFSYLLDSQYKINRFIINRQAKSTVEWQVLRRQLQDSSTEIVSFDDRHDFSWGCCLKVNTLWPPPNLAHFPLSTNNASISLLVTFLNVDIYLAGDLSTPYEQLAWQRASGKILSHKLTSDGKTEIFKASHHGSHSSSAAEFLKLANPGQAIFSVGKENSYGHPHRQVLNQFLLNGAKLWRTDEQGRIHIKITSAQQIDIKSQYLAN